MAKQPKSKIYTRRGDQGKTSLIFGVRVPKDHPRVAAYGTVDELNANLGSTASFLKDRPIKKILQKIQNELFNIGAELASHKRLKKQSSTAFYSLDQAKVAELEKLIDKYDTRLPALRTFILPAGTGAASLLHVARTVCRRAEREVVALSREEKINPTIIAYLNRLADLLFVLSRFLNKQAGLKEVHWKKE